MRVSPDLVSPKNSFCVATHFLQLCGVFFCFFNAIISVWFLAVQCARSVIDLRTQACNAGLRWCARSDLPVVADWCLRGAPPVACNSNHRAKKMRFSRIRRRAS
jgi:hypothetical protein